METPGLGVTSQYCKELADRLGCHVIAGYPEKLIDRSEDIGTVSSEKGSVGYNSAVLYGPDGFHANYRKTNLFITDKSWAIPGIA